MTTALQIINEAFEEIGVKEVGQSLPAEDADRGLRLLNRVLGTWATMRLLAPYSTTVSVPMTGAASYTIGPTGGLVAARPVKILSAVARDAYGMDYSVAVIDKARWDAIPDKTTTGGPPRFVWYDASIPNGRVYVYPLADSAYTLRLEAQALLASFANLSTDVTLADGYFNAMSLALAVAAAPGYSVQVSADLQRAATSAIRAVKRINAQSVNSAHELAAEGGFMIERGY